MTNIGRSFGQANGQISSEGEVHGRVQQICPDTFVMPHLTTLSSTSRLDVKGARLLADDLERLVTDPDAPAVNRDYRVVSSDTGVAVHTQHGGFSIPWRHIMTAVNGLRA